MYWDDWIKAGAFVLLVVMGFGLHFLSTLKPAPEPGAAVIASRSDAAPTTPKAAASKTVAPAPQESAEAFTPPPNLGAHEPASVMVEPAPAQTQTEPAPAQAQTEPAPTAPTATVETSPLLPADQNAASTGTPSAPPAAWPALNMSAPRPPTASQQSADDQDPTAPIGPQPPEAPTTTAPPADLETPAAPKGGPDAMMALRAAARTDDARAQYALALAYKMGSGVPADPAQSLLWLRRSAQGGLAVAARTLGIAYEEGLGVEKDAAEAAKWYTRAALAGDLQAMHNLAFFFTQGLGGLPRDGRQAAHWFRKAAERGLVASQVNLAILSSQGEQWGIEKKISDAYFWSAIAAERGDKQATQMRDLIGKIFAAKEKADLDQKIAAFRPLPIDVAANGGFEIAPEAFLPQSLRPPLSASEMTAIRQLLKSLGYTGNPTRDPVGATSDGLAPTDSVTSSIDERTELAIRAFQTDYGLPVTGAPDRNLLAALKAAPR